MSDSSELTRLAEALFGDDGFCRSYHDDDSGYGINRRNQIKHKLVELGFSAPAIDDREQLRRYFDALWNLPEAVYNAASADLRHSVTTIVFETDYVRLPNRFISLNPITPKETIMGAAAISTPITVTTQVLINGRLASQISDAELFQSIAHQEQAIKDLDGIENKPNSLVDEIAARKAGIQALVTYLDSRPKK